MCLNKSCRHYSNNDIDQTEDRPSLDHKHEHEHKKEDHHHHHEKKGAHLDAPHYDPATNKLISETKKSMMQYERGDKSKMSRADVMKSMAKE